MRIVVDLDGTICELRKSDESYLDVAPKKGAKCVLDTWVAEGHHIIIFTARHMKTCDGAVRMVRDKMEKLTVEWLRKHGIPYHELIFGKPYGDVYIDDLAIRFHDWSELGDQL